jgi:hypothetical protein
LSFFLPSSEVPEKATFRQRLRRKFDKAAFARVDSLGAFLLLAAFVLLVFGLEQGGRAYPWNSPAIICTLALPVILIAVFFFWERRIDTPSKIPEPVFPPSILKDRIQAVILL